MKTSLCLLALSLAAASPLPASRVPAPVTLPGLPVTHVAPTIQAGAVRVEVAARLGSPDAVLRDGTWLYRGFKATGAADALLAQGTLVVVFDRHRVVAMALANDTELGALRAQKDTPKPVLVAKQ